MSQARGTRVTSRSGARGCGTRWLRAVAVAGTVAVTAALGVASAAAAQPPGDAAANLAGDGKLEAALALLDTWAADHPDDPRMFPVLLKVVTAAPRQPTVDAVVERYRGRLASDQIAVLRAAPADLAELSGGVVQALQALELPGIPDASERRAALLLELGEVTLDTAPEGMPIVHAGLARSGEGLGRSGLEPTLRAAFHGSGTQGDGGAAGAVAGYGLVSLLAANGRTDEAAGVLEQMRRRFPRSPEYALAAAELNAGAGLPRVVAFPSPAMLLGSLVATCLPPCPPPAAVLLARPVERGKAVTALVADPPVVLAPPAAPPAAKPITRLMVAPEVGPAAEATSPPAKPATVAVAPDTGPAAVVAAPAAKPAAMVTTPAPEPSPAATTETPRTKSAVAVVAPETRPAPAVETPAPAPAAKRVVVVTSSAPTPATGQVGAMHENDAWGSARWPSSSDQAQPIPAPAVSGGAVADEPVRVSSQPTRPEPVAAGSTAEQISSRLSALLGASRAARPPATGAAKPASRATTPASPAMTPASDAAVPARPSSAPGSPVVRVSSQPDPAAYIVQTGAYRDADNALELEHELTEAGFAALARSYRVANGSIVHRVAVGGNMTLTKAEQLLARLDDLGYTGVLARRDDVSYLPPPPPSR